MYSYVLNHTGHVLPGFPKEMAGIEHKIECGDINSDGFLEIVRNAA